MIKLVLQLALSLGLSVGVGWVVGLTTYLTLSVIIAVVVFMILQSKIETYERDLMVIAIDFAYDLTLSIAIGSIWPAVMIIFALGKTGKIDPRRDPSVSR